MSETEPQGTGPESQDSGTQQDPETPQGVSTEPQGTGTTEPATEPQGTDWEAEAKKWEKRAKKDAEALDRIKKAAEGEVAETRQTVEQTAAERDALAAENLRLAVALEKGLPPDLAKRLVGSTRDELEADADTLLALVPKTSPSRRDATGGAQDAPPALSKDELLRAALGKS